ncbi:hypothetical protein BG004_000681 [Podila humilis]|nr:hypothetical protein BG004_000681 [Podila humilis]
MAGYHGQDPLDYRISAQNPFPPHSNPLQHHQHSHNSRPKSDERPQSKKKKMRSKSESSHGDIKDDDKKDKHRHHHDTHHHHRGSSTGQQPPSTIESLFKQEMQLREIVDERIMLEEWLHKRSSSLQLVWKRRWCALRDNCLYYYRTETDTKPLGVLHLADYCILATGSDLSRKSKHVFRLSAAENIPHESQNHLFYAESASILDMWVEAIQAHISHAMSTLTIQALGPLDIGLGGPQFSQSSSRIGGNGCGTAINGDNRTMSHQSTFTQRDQSVIDKVLDSLNLNGDELNEADPTLSDMNDPSTLIMPAQEHPQAASTGSRTQSLFPRSHQGIFVDDSLDGWPSSPSSAMKPHLGAKSSLEFVREHGSTATTTMRSATGIRTPPPPLSSLSTLSIPSLPRFSHGDSYSNSSSYTDISHSNYSSYSDAGQGGLKNRMAMHILDAKIGLLSSSTSSHSPLSPGMNPYRHRSQGSHPSHHASSLHDIEFESNISAVPFNENVLEHHGRTRANSTASLNTISSIESFGELSTVDFSEQGPKSGVQNANSKLDSQRPSALRSFGLRKDRVQRSDPIPSTGDIKSSENQSYLQKKQSMPSISLNKNSATPASLTGAADMSASSSPTKETKESTKKAKKLWSGFGGGSSSSTSSASSQKQSQSSSHQLQCFSESPTNSTPVSAPLSMELKRNNGTPTLSRSIDTNNPWFKDLVLISAPSKPSSVHSASSVIVSNNSNNNKKNSGRRLASKSMVSLTKDSLDHALPLLLSQTMATTHMNASQNNRDSLASNRTRSPSFSRTDHEHNLYQKAYQTLSPIHATTAPQSPKMLSFNRNSSHDGHTRYDLILHQPTVGDLLTGFSSTVDKNLEDETGQSSSDKGEQLQQHQAIAYLTLSGSKRQTKSSPILPFVAPLSPRLTAWTRLGEKVPFLGQQKNGNGGGAGAGAGGNGGSDDGVHVCVDPDVAMLPSLYEYKRQSDLPPLPRLIDSVDFAVGVSRHIIDPIELAHVMEQEEAAEEAKRLRESPGEGEHQNNKYPLADKISEVTLTEEKSTSAKVEENESENIVTVISDTATLACTDDSLCLLLPAPTAALKDDVGLAESPQKTMASPETPQRLSISIATASALKVVTQPEIAPQPSSVPPTIPRRSPRRTNSISPILRDL